MYITPRHGNNFTISSEKLVEFVGYCTGDDTWAIKDVHTNIVYDDLIHAECQKLYENTPRYHENIDDLGLEARFSMTSYKLGRILKESILNDLAAVNRMFDIMAFLVRDC
uniref:Phage protein n=1 Tax=Panagrellus redivivus TaxID=6233 RepID=A0A7E4VWW6_PANRE